LKNWQKILIPFVITLVVGGIYLFIVFKHRQDPGVVANKQPEQQLSADDVAVVRMQFPQHFDDVVDLQGKSVWMKNGYSMPYYAYVGGKASFAKPVGLLPPAQRLDIQKIVKIAVPASVSDSVQHGSHQAMAVFTLPGGKDQFVTPIGYLEGNDEYYYTDLLFYYDDPHTIYSNWPKDTWAAIDAHQVKPGMTELQTRMAIGMKEHPDGQTEGDRTVDYDVNGKHTLVTYQNKHATTIKGE
jgi:hypothetical protein